VGPVQRGQTMNVRIDGLDPIAVRVD